MGAVAAGQLSDSAAGGGASRPRLKDPQSSALLLPIPRELRPPPPASWPIPAGCAWVLEPGSGISISKDCWGGREEKCWWRC